MTVHLYLSLLPEALLTSQLDPVEFGSYYAVGTTKKSQGQAMFIELDPDFRHPYFQIEEGIKRTTPHEDGSPKRSIYISSYRVLEHIPLDAMKKLYLVTRFGEVLALEPSHDIPEDNDTYHMFQEIAPVHPLVVSTQNAQEFYNTIIHKPLSLMNFPAICFVELGLGELAEDPENGGTNNIPYTNISHLRECLVEIKSKKIQNKMVNRTEATQFPYRMIKHGIFIGNQEGLIYYPMPSREALRGKYYRWWRSANQ
jgi:hypothetical protein